MVITYKEYSLTRNKLTRWLSDVSLREIQLEYDGSFESMINFLIDYHKTVPNAKPDFCSDEVVMRFTNEAYSPEVIIASNALFCLSRISHMRTNFITRNKTLLQEKALLKLEVSSKLLEFLNLLDYESYKDDERFHEVQSKFDSTAKELMTIVSETRRDLGINTTDATLKEQSIPSNVLYNCSLASQDKQSTVL